MRISITAVVVFALVQQVSASPLPDYPFVYVRGTARSEIPPNIAEVTFNIQAVGESAAVADATVQKRSTDILTFLATHKVSARDIAAHEISKDVRTTDYSNKTPAILGYEFTRKFSLRIRDLATWSDLSDFLATQNNVGELEVSFDRTDREQLQNELVAKAAVNARENAERLATGFGQHLGGVVAISTSGDFGQLGQAFGFAGLVEIPPPVVDIMVSGQRMTKALSVPATIRITASVNAIYKLE